ncbi:MAG: hypothetical protein GY937_21295 [bacterium]|nr:hypothetical protein [bacterium]
MQAGTSSTAAGETTRLRVATLNVWGLWGLLSRHLRPRMQAIPEQAEKLSLDVFAIQESWTDEGRDLLLSGLREIGLKHAWHNPRTSGGSGLLLVSRHPLGEARFHRFRLSGLPERIDHGDYFSGKGAVVVSIDTPAGPVDILDTHLVAHYASDPIDTYFGHRVGQVIEIAQLLSPSERPVVALGDFNVRESGPEYPILVGLSGLVDAATLLDRRFDTILAPHPYREIDHRERIDYVWTRDGLGMAARVQHLERAFDAPLSFGGDEAAYSDHAGIVAEIVLSRAPTARGWQGASEPALALAREALEQGRTLARARRRMLHGGAAAGLVGLGLCVAGRRLTRREWLRRCLWFGAGLGAVGSSAALGLAEAFGSDELDALTELEGVLGSLRRSG